MKFCQQCGNQLPENARFCPNCGFELQPLANTKSTVISNDLLVKLSTRVKTNGIIWIVIACVQILIGILGAWFTLLVGVLNIISAIRDIKNSDRILTNPYGIVKAYEPITGPIVVLISDTSFLTKFIIR